MSQAPTRPLPGGPFAIDLLNTRWGPEGQSVDWLDDDEAVAHFVAERRGSLDAAEISKARAALTEARDLVQRLFVSGADQMDESTIQEVNGVLASATSSLSATRDGLELSISSQDPVCALSIEALVSAVELLSDRPDRIRSCDHDECTLWFLDTSKAGRRRWCSMETCGNRAKAQRHYDRARQD